MSRRVSIDMTGVESYTRCPEGTWLAKLKKIEEVEIQGSGDDGLKAQFEVIKGEAKGNSVFETFSLAEKALWKLKQCLEAMGMKASGKLKLDLDKMEGKTCLIDVIHDEYNGQKRAKISAYSKPESDEDEDDEDEEEEDEEETTKKSSKKSKATTSKKSKKPEPEEDEDDEEEEDEDEDEEPEPPKKSKKSSKTSKPVKKATSKSKKKDEDEDDDDEDDWEEDDD